MRKHISLVLCFTVVPFVGVLFDAMAKDKKPHAVPKVRLTPRAELPSSANFAASMEKDTAHDAPLLTLDEIREALLQNPPNTGDLAVREDAILALDDILKDVSSPTSQEVFDFYTSMMGKVKQELVEEVTAGANIWIMYNHGFIVKTPEIVFAFDLVDGYNGWQTARGYKLPNEVLEQIEMLFISHWHGDHNDGSVKNKVRSNGGEIVGPSDEGSYSFAGLEVNVHHGLHSMPVMIFEVTTPGGLKIVHTGDNQTSTALPEIDDVDVLLLNGWVNESGGNSAVTGMRNCLQKLTPTLMIPGHFQELSHEYRPANPAGRALYAWGLAVDDVPLPSEVQVMAWGEKYYFFKEPVGVDEQAPTESLPGSFALHQNYPNPFNPSTTIGFDLPRETRANLTVYDVQGRRIEKLHNGPVRAGYHDVRFDGSHLPSGIYLYELRTKVLTEVRKMLILK